jgi:uncharacterized damage-inducible protein DinB
MKPNNDEYTPFYGNYVAKVTAENPQDALEQSLDEALLFFQELPAEKANHRYQPEKWSVKELLQHVIDTERIMAYRALRFARKDATELSGYDEDAYVDALDMQDKKLEEVFEEYVSQRKATISLFKSFAADTLLRQGKANGQPVSVRALAYIIAGHQKHHFQIVKERYLEE